ncbi:MAG: hypothetical protein R3D03_07730 [Geminicoccaceae bacterium]
MLAQATCEGLGLIATVIDDIRAVGKADARQLTVKCTLGKGDLLADAQTAGILRSSSGFSWSTCRRR